MRRWAALGLAAGLVLSASALVRGGPGDPGGGGGAASDDGDGVSAAWLTGDERAAITLLEQDKPIAARRAAESVLARDADSIAGHYVLGRVLHEAEGSLARAIYHLGHARELYERKYPPSSRPTGSPWKFHRELLLSIAALAGEMGEYDYQLAMLEYHDGLYRPARPGERAWPLMKVGRMAEALAAAQQAREMKDPGERSLGLNALCAIGRAGNDRAAARTACAAAYDHASKTEGNLPGIDNQYQSTLAVHAYNAALAARAAFAPDDAEKIALAGTHRLAFTPANPWRFLVELYIDQGRGGDAANALREMQRWRTRQPPQLRDQDRAESDAVVATVLLLAGRTEPALALIERAIDFPDRRGLASTEEWQARAAHVLLRGAIARAHGELLDEAASVGGGGGVVDAARRRLRGWADDEVVRGMLDDDDRLVDSLRLFGERGVTGVPAWLVGDLVRVAGPGVMGAVLREARERDKTPALEPYWKSIEAEVELARGNDAESRDLARAALAALPPTEVLVRARAAAVGAMAAHELDDDALERELLTSAYQLDPSVIRRLGLSLPVTVQGRGPGAAEVVEMLERSPRLRSESGGFRIDVDASPGAIRICLRSPEGNELRCVPEEPGAPPTPPTPTRTGARGEAKPEPMTPARAVEEFHKHAFAMPLGLTGADMSSLDGSTGVAEQAVRERVDQLLGEIAK
ncbi:MAG TPA: hypothetical protein VK698_33500 [Kofleriaceae bacterium]|nr:hypothetical protein [Kofleriaceae bacterium]